MRFSPFSSFSFILVWERSSRRDSVSVASHDDFKRHPHAHPPPTETEFRLTDPFPKRCANFGNESRNTSASPAAPPCKTWTPSRASPACNCSPSAAARSSRPRRWRSCAPLCRRPRSFPRSRSAGAGCGGGGRRAGRGGGEPVRGLVAALGEGGTPLDDEGASGVMKSASAMAR